MSRAVPDKPRRYIPSPFFAFSATLSTHTDPIFNRTNNIPPDVLQATFSPIPLTAQLNDTLLTFP